jgi:hypothetical protein
VLVLVQQLPLLEFLLMLLELEMFNVQQSLSVDSCLSLKQILKLFAIVL